MEDLKKIRKCKKTFFYDLKTAQFHAEKYNKVNKKIRFKELRAYFCPKCNLFHLTSTPDIQCLIQEIEKLKQENIYLNEIKHKQYSQIGQLKESHLIEQLRKKDEIIKQLKKDIREVIQKLISSKT